MCLPRCQRNLRNTTQLHVLSWIAQRFLPRLHHLFFCNLSCILHIRVTQLKSLIGISPHGAITFVSSLYTGEISDKEITRCSGILDLVEAGDSVMADKGFDIEDLLRGKSVSLNLPPFLESRSQFSAAEVQEGQDSCREGHKEDQRISHF